jgi:hypothetical protein
VQIVTPKRFILKPVVNQKYFALDSENAALAHISLNKPCNHPVTKRRSALQEQQITPKKKG